jgi:hypothetical protein
VALLAKRLLEITSADELRWLISAEQQSRRDPERNTFQAIAAATAQQDTGAR